MGLPLSCPHTGFHVSFSGTNDLAGEGEHEKESLTPRSLSPMLGKRDIWEREGGKKMEEKKEPHKYQ